MTVAHISSDTLTGIRTPLCRTSFTAVSDVAFLEVQTAHPGWENDIERRADKYGWEGTMAPVVELAPYESTAGL